MKVLFLFGEICSGKSSLTPDGTCITIPVSSAVRRLISAHSREALQNTAHLATLIADMIADDIWHYDNFIFDCEDTTPEYIIIDGIRQYVILQQLEQYLASQYPTWQVEYKWLEVDRDERKRRFEARKDPKDTLTFEEAEKRDNALGLSDLFRILKEQNKI